LIKSELKLKKWQLMPSITAIQPILVGSNQAALNLSEFLLSRGILVPAIRPPTVPKNTARLRVSISAGHTVEDIHQLMNALHEAEELL
jgi:8-amino-7-oxononanoate synthase